MGEFFELPTIQEILAREGSIFGNNGKSLNYVEIMAKNLADSCLKDFHDQVPPDKAHGRLMQRIGKLRKRTKPRTLKMIVDRVNQILRESPEFRGKM